MKKKLKRIFVCLYENCNHAAFKTEVRRDKHMLRCAHREDGMDDKAQYEEAKERVLRRSNESDEPPDVSMRGVDETLLFAKRLTRRRDLKIDHFNMAVQFVGFMKKAAGWREVYRSKDTLLVAIPIDIPESN